MLYVYIVVVAQANESSSGLAFVVVFREGERERQIERTGKANVVAVVVYLD